MKDFKIEECNKLPCPELIECDIDDVPCDVTCGGGSKQCQNQCQNGVFGNSTECPISAEFTVSTCNEQKCPIVEFCELNEIPCSVSCGGGTKSCENICRNGEFGDIGCDLADKISESTCAEQDCRKLKINYYPLS